MNMKKETKLPNHNQHEFVSPLSRSVIYSESGAVCNREIRIWANKFRNKKKKLQRESEKQYERQQITHPSHPSEIFSKGPGLIIEQDMFDEDED